MLARIACAVSLAGISLACRGAQFSIGPYVGPVTPDGTLAIDGGDNGLDSLGLDDAERSGGVRFDSKAPRFHYTVMAQTAGWEGDGVLEADLNLSSVGDPVTSQSEALFVRNLFTFDVIPDERIELGLGLGLDLDIFTAEIRTPSETVDFAAVALTPMLAARFGAHVGRLTFEASAAASSLRYGDVDVAVFDVDANVRMAFIGDPQGLAGFVVLGYRYSKFDIEYDDGADHVHAELGFTGPYAAAQIAW